MIKIKKKKWFSQFLLIGLILLILLSHVISAKAQVAGTEKRYIRIGELQSHFSAYGSERAWNNTYYEGLIWPADYYYQDNAVIKRSWIAAQDFTDAEGAQWEAYGIYISQGYVDESLFPMELKQTAKFPPPTVVVDGNNITAPYADDVDEIDPEQIPDRIVSNIVNTSMGLTMTRRILAFSQQYHDSYYIKEFILTNTGNVDYDDEIELNAPLKGVRIGWGTRYSVCREGAFKMDNQQSWGKHSWVTRRGEDYPQHASDIITEDNPIVQWLRCAFSWAGQSAKNAYDNIGAPDIKKDGRLCAPQHAGTVVIHVDKSATDPVDDPNQPTALGWHAGDTYPSVGNMQKEDELNMTRLYDMLSGNPYKGLGGTDRMDEVYMESNPDPVTVHNDGGGTNVWICYGPFDLEPGESIKIVEAEGINGISRQVCKEVGAEWKKAYDDPAYTGPFTLPDGSTTNDKDEYKNAWVYTGKDSIIEIFGRAKRNFDADYMIPQPPFPPPVFEVSSGGDRIQLSWEPSPSEDDADFVGYKLYRAVGKPDTTYAEIADVPKGITSFDDVSAVRGYDYFYYISAYNDGSNNPGVTNPAGPLHSNRFYTRTTEPANLRRQAGALDQIRIVPNPYNVRAHKVQFPGDENVDRIMFYNIPGQCTIKIFTERGDLIETIEHTDGSGDHAWNSVTSSRQVIVSGVYIAHFETPDGRSAVQKFVIIR